jgi:hypothetical protein
MALFRNFGVNLAEGGQVTPKADKSAESLVRRTRVRLRAMPPISLNLQKMAYFWIGNLSVPLIKPWMGTSEKPIVVPEQVSPKRPAGRQHPRSSFP